MLRITKIRLRNFGPFKGDQSIDLPEKDGVTIIFGENMRGKTTLINAVRYALFGKVLSRGEHQLALHVIGNWEAAKDGEYGFRVVLEFEHDGLDYTLTRECKPRAGIKEPKTDLDYSQTHFLKRGSDVLSPSDCETTLARVMPEQVSRFFLFDGELLKQYEELLINESDMGREIKEAIERILGVPVLTWARYDLGEITKEAEKKEARTAQKDQRTRELGTQNSALLEQRSSHEKELARLKGNLAKLKATKSENEEMVRQNEKTKTLLNELESLDARINEIDSKNNAKRERLALMVSNAWSWLLKPELDRLYDEAQDKLNAIHSSTAQREVSGHLTDLVTQALLACKCKVCGQSIDAKTAKRLKAQIDESQLSPKGDSAANLEAAVTRLKTLREIAANADGKDAALELLNAIEDGVMERTKCHARIDEIKEKTKDLDESKLRRIMAAYDKTVQEIAILENGIEEEQKKLNEIKENIDRIQIELDRIGGADLTKEGRRRQLCASLSELFTKGVEVYRERLRKKVEKDASALFIKLTTEPEYASLKINESYGLIIIHKDGSEIPVRSAGAEHVVALSLMGALQHNAPLEGPIVMDSPFGRLDDGHTSRIVQALPSMAKQVILLVYESELEPKVVRNTLKGDLLSEYKIGRKTSRHSVLEKSKE